MHWDRQALGHVVHESRSTNDIESATAMPAQFLNARCAVALFRCHAQESHDPLRLQPEGCQNPGIEGWIYFEGKTAGPAITRLLALRYSLQVAQVERCSRRDCSFSAERTPARLSSIMPFWKSVVVVNISCCVSLKLRPRVAMFLDNSGSYGRDRRSHNHRYLL